MDARMNIHKRPKEEMEPEEKHVKEEQDLWDVVEPPPVPPPFTFEVPRETAMAAASMSQGSSSKGYVWTHQVADEGSDGCIAKHVKRR